jgi:hypothetical protein
MVKTRLAGEVPAFAEPTLGGSATQSLVGFSAWEALRQSRGGSVLVNEFNCRANNFGIDWQLSGLKTQSGPTDHRDGEPTRHGRRT